MKDNFKPVLITLVLIFLAFVFFQPCNEKPIIEPDNSVHFEQIETLKSELAVLSVLNDSLELSYKEVLNRKDSVRIVIKNKYIQVLDTNTNEVIDCLPKMYVDSILMVQDETDKICGQNLSVKDEIIVNLTNQNNVKDTIISNYDEIVQAKDQEIKRQKKNKIKSFFVGVGVGALIRSLF